MNSTLKGFDWITAILYVALVLMGWFTINAASYAMDDASIFDFARVSGKQFVWFCLSLILVGIIFIVDAKTYMAIAPFLYIGVMALLFLTIFIGTNINGSHSWIKIGSMSIQPAEFGKFSTSLMLAWLFNSYGFKFTQTSNFIKACIVVLVPVLLIILQNETGSALVYFSLALLFYRQGMNGMVLWFGFCCVFIFVIGVKYSVADLPDGVILSPGQLPEPSRLGENLVLLFIPYMIAAMLAFACSDTHEAYNVVSISLITGACYYAITRWIPLPFVIEWRWVAIPLCIFSFGRCLWLWLFERMSGYLVAGAFGIFFLLFQYSADYAFHNVLLDHQRGRIEVLLGMKDDPKITFFKRISYAVSKMLYKGASAILISSTGFEKKLRNMGLTCPIEFFPNYAEKLKETDFTVSREQLGIDDGDFVIGFSGNIGKAQGLDSLIDVTEKAEKNLKWLIVGDGPELENIKNRVSDCGLDDNFVFTGWVPSENVSAYLNICDSALVSLKNSEVLNLTVPAKLQTYMAAGKPILAFMNGAGADIVNSSGCGISAEAENNDALGNAIDEMRLLSKERLMEMGNRAKSYCAENYERERLLDFLQDFIAKQIDEREGKKN